MSFNIKLVKTLKKKTQSGLFLALMFSSTVFLNSCGSSKSTPAVVPLISDKANVIVQPALDPNSVGTGTLIFDELASKSSVLNVATTDADSDPLATNQPTSIADTQPGDVLILEPTSNIPTGVFKKVVSVQTIDGKVMVETEDAALTDIVEQGRVELTGSLSADPNSLLAKGSGIASALIESHDGFELYDASRIREIAAKEIATSPSTEVGELTNCAKVTNKDGKQISPTFIVRFNQTLGEETLAARPGSLKGCFGMVFRFEFNIWIDNFQLREFKFISHPTVFTEASIETNQPVTFAKESIVKSFSNFTKIQFQIGPVPVWIQPVVNIVVGANGTIGAAIVAGAAQQTNISAGIKYENDTWSPILELHERFIVQPPTFYSDAHEFEFYAGPELLMNLYSVAGPKVGIHGVIATSADQISNPWWETKTGIRGTVGAEITLFDKRITQASFPLFTALTTIADAGGPADPPPTAAPNDVTIVQGIGALTTSWIAVGDATSYNVYWSTSPNVTKDSTLVRRVGTSYRHSHLTNFTTYYYRVSSVNSSGESALGLEMSDIALDKPPAPIPLEIAVVGQSGVSTTTWATNAETNELVDTYNLYWSLTPGVTDLDNKITFNNDVFNRRGYVHYGLSADGTLYYYRLSATNSEGTSDLSDEVTVRPYGKPRPIFNTATPGDGFNTITWKGSEIVDTYDIVYATTVRDLVRGIGSSRILSNVTSPFIHGQVFRPLKNGTEYFYRVIGHNDIGSSKNYSFSSATPHVAIEGPVTNMNATSGLEESDLTWTASPGAESYNIFWSNTTGVSKENYQSVIYGVTETNFKHTSLRADSTYFYVVEALNSFNESSISAEFSATPVPAIPKAVLTQPARAQNGSVHLSWNQLISNGTKPTYNIYWSTSPGVTKLTGKLIGNISNVRSESTSRFSESFSGFYWHTGLENDTTYYYIITAVNSTGESAASYELTATPVFAIAAPTTPGFYFPTPDNESISLSWISPIINSYNSPSSYNLYWSTEPTVSRDSNKISIAESRYTHTGLVSGTTYYYILEAVNDIGISGTSVVRSAKAGFPPLPARPSNLAATGGVEINQITWTGNSEFESYTINWRSAGVSGQITNITASPYTHVGVNPDVAYSYSVSGVDQYSRTVRGLDNVSATAFAVVNIPDSPTNAGVSPSDKVNTITWMPSTGATSYTIYWSTTPGVTTASNKFVSASSVNALGTVIENHTNLNNGSIYYYRVAAKNSAGESGLSNEVSATPVAPVILPVASNVTVSPGNTSNTINWSSTSTNATPYTYNIYWSTAASVSTSSAKISNVTGTSYTHTGLNNQLPYYYIITTTDSGLESLSTLFVSGTPIAPPNTPVGVNAAAGSSNTVSWFDGSPTSRRASSFNLYWSTTPGVTAGSTKISDATSPYNFSGDIGTTYYYVVTAVNAGGESAVSTEVSALITDLPSQPTNVIATAASGEVTLSWAENDASENATYTIYRSTTPGVTTANTRINLDAVTSFTQSLGISNGTTYYFVVTANNLLGESVVSAEVSATPRLAPIVPQNVNSIPGTEAEIVIDWSASLFATAYNIYWSTVPGVTTASNIIDNVTGTTYTHTGLSRGATYYYIVVAKNDLFESAISSEVSSTVIATPVAPSNLAIIPGDTLNAIEWAPSADATSYNIYHSTSPGVTTGNNNFVFPVLFVGDLGAQLDNHNGLSNGVTYYYRVSAVNSAGESSLSNEASGTPVPLFNPFPPSISVTEGNATTTISWAAQTGGEDPYDYNLYWSTSSDVSTSSNKIPIDGSETSYTFTGLTNGTTYYYVMTAVVPGYESVATFAESATPIAPPSPPANLTALPGRVSNTISWTDSPSVDSYNLYTATTPNVTTSSNKVTDVTNPYVFNGDFGTYYYAVTAVNAGGESVVSNEVVAMITDTPNQPSNFVATAGIGSIALDWDDDNIASYYTVSWSTEMGVSTAGSSSSTAIGTVADSNYTITGLTNGTTYYVIVTAVGGQESPESVELSATPVLPTTMPTNLLATPSVSSNTLTWDANDVAESASYNIYWSQIPGATSADNKIANVSGTNYVHTGLTNFTPYYYVITAENSLGESFESAQTVGTPTAIPATPANVIASAGQAADTVLSWASSVGATSYNIYWLDSAGVTIGNGNLITVTENHIVILI